MLATKQEFFFTKVAPEQSNTEHKHNSCFIISLKFNNLFFIAGRKVIVKYLFLYFKDVLYTYGSLRRKFLSRGGPNAHTRKNPDYKEVSVRVGLVHDIWSSPGPIPTITQYYLYILIL